MTHLQALSIGGSKLSDNALELLRLLTTLQYLDLGGPHPGAKGLRDTGGAPLPDAVPRAIASLKQLRALKLAYARMGADGLRILSSLDQVEKRALEGCGLVDVQALAELAHWKSLKDLDVQATKVTPQGVAALEKAKPGLKILSDPFPPM